jgi:hypothetical protein
MISPTREIDGLFFVQRFLQVFALLAAARTEFCQRSKLLPGLADIARLEIELAQILASCLVIRPEL